MLQCVTDSLVDGVLSLLPTTYIKHKLQHLELPLHRLMEIAQWAIDVKIKTATFVHLPLSHTLKLFTGCEVDPFVDRVLQLLIFMYFLSLDFRCG